MYDYILKYELNWMTFKRSNIDVEICRITTRLELLLGIVAISSIHSIGWNVFAEGLQIIYYVTFPNSAV